MHTTIFDGFKITLIWHYDAKLESIMKEIADDESKLINLANESEVDSKR